MFVGLDAIPLAAPRTGVGHYTFELARHLARISPADEFELVSPFPFAQLIETNQDLPSNLRLVKAKAGILRRRWFAVGLPMYIKQSKVDLFHGTNYEVPIWSRCPSVLTIHDLSLLLYPETHQKRLVNRARLRLPLMARRASLIITPSESVKREVCEHLRIESSRVFAIAEAPRDVFRPASAEQIIETKRRLNIEDDFILFVGTIEPRKNLSTLLRAFAEILHMTTLRPQLVIAGREGWLTAQFFAEVEKSGVKDRLRLTGYVTDEDLRALYSSCGVFVYPSLYEGFGLPPLEAMACGAPVITSRIPSIIETVGTEAAVLIQPIDAQMLARKVVEILTHRHERQRLSSLGQQRASDFTWEKTARATLNVYQAALKRRNKQQPSERNISH
jgi:glycosyltransferase involved in cell wall biosynthesis